VLRPVAERDDEYAAAFRDDPDLGRRAGFDVDPTGEWALSRLEGAAERRAAGRLRRPRRAAPARGRGVARTAISLVLDWLFEVGFRRAELRTRPNNEPMCTLAERLGFVREGVLREFAVERVVPVDVVVFGLLAAERRAAAG